MTTETATGFDLMDTDALAEQAPTTATFAVDKSNFATGLKYAKKFGGRYNPADKTWTITVKAMGGAVNAPRRYGLAPVVTRPLAGHDGGCAAHWGGGCECRS